jgi:hypothetical protein
MALRKRNENYPRKRKKKKVFCMPMERELIIIKQEEVVGC